MTRKMVVTLIRRLSLDEMSAENISIVLGIPLEMVREVLSDVDYTQPHQEDARRQAPDTSHYRRRGLSTQERNEEIREKMKEGATLDELADKYDLAESTVKNITSGVQSEMIEKRNKEIRRERKAGASRKELAEKYQLGEASITIICRGLNGRGGRKSKEERNKQIREELANGVSKAALAEKYQLSASWIHQICKGISSKKYSKKVEYFDFLEMRNPVSLREFADHFSISHGYASALMAEFAIRRSNQLVAAGYIRIQSQDGELEDVENAVLVQCGSEKLLRKAVDKGRLRF